MRINIKIFASFIPAILFSIAVLSCNKGNETELKPTTNTSILVKVNVNEIITEGATTRFGINLNAGIDKDINRGSGARSLEEALREMGVKHLRYPGGKKSLYYSWAAAPFTDPATQYWVPGWYKNNAKSTLNFDEFMTISQRVGAVPHINVAYNPEAGLGYELAAAWVKYANITKSYGVKYWEIGNEMWQGDLKFTTEILASVVKTYSAAMKAVDPTIKIGVSWSNYQAIINACGNSLDYVTMSDYTGANFKTYENYASYINVGLTKTYASSSKKLIASEFAPIDFATNGYKNSDTGSGLITFDQTGQVLLNNNCEYACFWNTRWYSEIGNMTDALDPLNNLRATGKALSVWGKFIKNKMVATEGNDASIVSYASFDDIKGELNVFLINKKEAPQTISVTISPENKFAGTFDVWQYKGENSADINPSFTKTNTIEMVDNKINEIILPAASITVVLLKKNSK